MQISAKERIKPLILHLSYNLSQEKLRRCRGATYYDLVEPVIRVGSNGQVERL